MVAITFRTTGVWGVGTGADLSAVQIDTNFYNLKFAVEALQVNPTEPNQIANITVAGNQITFVMDDATTFGPFLLPIAEFRDRGEWAPATDYLYGDIFTRTTGLYMVLQDHTSAGVFNPDAANGFGPLYRKLFDASGLTMTFLDAGYPAEGEPLKAFDVFSIPDVGVFLVLQDHDALAVFDPDAVGVDTNPLYKKIFSAIETAVARLQFQYAGSFPADGSMIWKYINDDPRDLTFAANMPDCLGHIEVAATTAIVFKARFGGADVATITFNPGALLDGVGGQFGEFLSDGFTVPTGTILRFNAPTTSDTTAKFLTLAIVGQYVEP